MQVFLYVPGTRVRVRRGLFPIDPALVGRTGIVLDTDAYRPGHYAVQLDGEREVRDFVEDELEPLEDGRPLQRAGDPGPGIGG